MRFKRSVQAYGRTPQPLTPYQKAGQLWDERIGSARHQARNWRIVAFFSIGLSGGMVCGNIWLSRQSRIVPYVVEVDSLGAPQALNAAQLAYRPTDPQVAWALSKFVANVRGASLDPVVTRDAWLQAYDFTTERGGRFLNDYARMSGALTRIGERTVSVQVTSVVRASDRSFQVKWREDAYERGSLDGSTRWTAILTVTEKTPRDAETLRRNPLGIYVDAIDWSQELEAPSDKVDRPAVMPAASTTAGQSPSAGSQLRSANITPAPGPDSSTKEMQP